METCEAILRADFPCYGWELVIVDNASTDETGTVAAELSAASPGTVQSIHEGCLGLSAARSAGARAARGRLLVFIDDDILPEPGWLAAYEEALADEGTWGAGGPIDLLFDGPRPSWLTDHYLPYLGAFDKGDRAVPLTYNEYPRGGNMAFRRWVLERLGPFSHQLGVKGESLMACEEIEFALRIERAGGRLVYVPGARVHHKVEVAKLTSDRLARRFGAQGRSEAVVEWRHGGLAGLRAGLVRSFKFGTSPVGGASRSAKTLRRCRRRTLVGYLLGAAHSVVSVERYRPVEPTPLKSWAPPPV